MVRYIRERFVSSSSTKVVLPKEQKLTVTHSSYFDGFHTSFNRRVIKYNTQFVDQICERAKVGGMAGYSG